MAVEVKISNNLKNTLAHYVWTSAKEKRSFITLALEVTKYQLVPKHVYYECTRVFALISWMQNFFIQLALEVKISNNLKICLVPTHKQIIREYFLNIGTCFPGPIGRVRSSLQEHSCVHIRPSEKTPSWDHCYKTFFITE